MEREWYSLRDIQEVFRFSRKAITAILLDAQKQGMPVRVAVLDFRGHPEFCGMPEGHGENSLWMEWVSPVDIERIYGFSQESLRKILRDAEWKGEPIKTMRLPFKNGSQAMRCPRRYQVERKSLNAYLEAHLVTLS